MKDETTPATPSSPVTPKSEQCRVARWATAWAEYFRNSAEEQNLAEIFTKDEMTRELPQQRENSSG